VHERYTAPMQARIAGTFRFDVPVETLDFDSMFTGAVKVSLLNAEPVLVRGVWLELLP